MLLIKYIYVDYVRGTYNMLAEACLIIQVLQILPVYLDWFLPTVNTPKDSP